MLDEKGLRRPGFSGDSVPIRLADGQDWCFPKPWFEFRPTFADGKVGASSMLVCGPEFRGKLASVNDAGPGREQIAALFDLAIYMLDRNYDLRPEDYAAILVYGLGDADNSATWQAIADVATGNGPTDDEGDDPKGAGPAGSASPA